MVFLFNLISSRGSSGLASQSVTHSLRFYGDGISFWVVCSQVFWLRVLPGGTCLVQPRWMPTRSILGGGWTRGVTFWPFLNSLGWWWLISSVFLTRTSCHKTTHANCYYGAWPGWAVLVSVLPRTLLKPILTNVSHVKSGILAFLFFKK